MLSINLITAVPGKPFACVISAVISLTSAAALTTGIFELLFKR